MFLFPRYVVVWLVYAGGNTKDGFWYAICVFPAQCCGDSTPPGTEARSKPDAGSEPPESGVAPVVAVNGTPLLRLAAVIPKDKGNHFVRRWWYLPHTRRTAMMFKTDWNKARIVLAVARSGSFRQASILTGVDVATISRNVADMERALGVGLFDRGRRGANPTETGLRLIRAAERVESGMVEFDRLCADGGGSGKVRLASTPGIVSHHLLPAFSGYMAESHPLHAGASAIPRDVAERVEVVELGHPGADLEVFWLSPGEEPETDAAAVERIGHMRVVPMAGRSYLENNPKDVDTLRGHRIVNFGQIDGISSVSSWFDFVASGPVRDVATVGSAGDHARAVVMGGGVGLLGDLETTFHPTLVPLREVGARFGDMRLALWIATRRGGARSDAVRTVRGLAVNLFRSSHWFRAE